MAAARIDDLLGDLAARGSALVAFSGGVDSGVVAALAWRALGERALAVTAAAETLAGRELDVERADLNKVREEFHEQLSAVQALRQAGGA
jgi:uncharacterized protein